MIRFFRNVLTIYRHSWLILVALWIPLVLGGYFYIISLLKQEAARDRLHWETRLALTNDKRRAEVDAWMQDHLKPLKALSQNPTLQLFLTELDAAGWDVTKVSDGDIRTGFVQSLLEASALRAAAGTVVPSGNITATENGIALIGKEKQVVLSTQSMAPLMQSVQAILASPATSGQVIGPVEAQGKSYLLFVTPVTSVQPEKNEAPIAWLIASAPLTDGFFALLKDPSSAKGSLESLLVRQEGMAVRYVSPLQGGDNSGGVNVSGEEREAVHAAFKPGEVGVKTDYLGKTVWVIGQKVTDTPFTLLTKIDAKDAQTETSLRARWIHIGYISIAGGLTLVFILIWRQATAVRARQDAIFYKSVANRIERQERLLQYIMNVMPQGLFITDMENKFRYVNQVFASKFGVSATQMIGKTLQAMLGASDANRYVTMNQRALDSQGLQSAIYRKEDERTGEYSVTLESHLAVRGIPVAESSDAIDGVLVLEKDMTELARERERKEYVVAKLLETLLMLVDSRDPYAANHSRNVGELAHEVAAEMNLEPALVETASLAGKFMNVGKITVPEAILTQKSQLGSTDLERIRNSIQASADFLDGIPFEGPVVETLRQSQERADGGGPLGLRGADILVTARIIAVCNSFIAMASPRAYRAPLSVNEAVSSLMQQIDKVFDRAVVAALVNYLDNRGGRAVWQQKLNINQ